jgi:hypothetical protein
MEEMELKT